MCVRSVILHTYLLGSIVCRSRNNEEFAVMPFRLKTLKTQTLENMGVFLACIEKLAWRRKWVLKDKGKSLNVYLFISVWHCAQPLWGGGSKKKWIKYASNQQRALILLMEVSHKQNTSNKVISATAEVHVTCVGIKRKKKISAGFLKENSVV